VTHAIVGANHTTTRTTTTTPGATLATVIANHVAIDEVCSTDLIAYVFARPTSTTPRTAFVTAKSTLIAAEPTRAVASLIYISIGSTAARTRPETSRATTSPKS